MACKTSSLFTTRTRLAALFITYIGSFLYFVGFVTPSWITYTFDTVTYNAGFFLTCVENDCTTDVKKDSLFKMSQVLGSLGFAMYTVYGVSATLTFIWTKHWKKLKGIKLTAGITALAAGIFIAMATLTMLQSDTFEESKLSYSAYLGLVADVIAIILTPFYIIDGITTTKQLDKPRDKRQKRWDRTEPILPGLAPETTFILDRCPTYHSQIMKVYNEPRPSTSKQSTKRSSTLLNMIKNKNPETMIEIEKKEERAYEQDYDKTNNEDSREAPDQMLLFYPEVIALQPLTEKNDFENKPEVIRQETIEIRDTDIDISGVPDDSHNEILDKNQDEKQEFSNEALKTVDINESESPVSKKKKKKKKHHKTKKQVKEETIDPTSTDQSSLLTTPSQEKDQQADGEKPKNVYGEKIQLDEQEYDKSTEGDVRETIKDNLLFYPEVPALQQSENNIVHYENKQKYKPDKKTGMLDSGILDREHEKQEDSKEEQTNEDMIESTGTKKKKKKHHKKNKTAKEETTDQTITEQTNEQEERMEGASPRVVGHKSSELEGQLYDKITEELEVNEILKSEEMKIEDKSERKDDKRKKKKKKKKDELPHFFEDFVVKYKTGAMPESTELSLDHLLQASETTSTAEENIKITEKPIPKSTINQRVISAKFRINKM
ncbi:interaptin-like [Mytilus trossulus]|uniref:interaptin-like n=1 Tax=Mytilus trossulus TaxID=6551 RepID=UPI0030072A79